ncbi:MAG: IscA/HesB family protein [Proteobacteria bacterium]|nr:IscA/HesB family protein [Pseudomonadota bacterium]
MIVVTETARQAAAELWGDNSGALRVRLQFAGCCDPMLGLTADRVRDGDHVTTVDGLTLVIDPETMAAAGEVTVDYVDRGYESGFALTSAKPLSEWEGLALCQIEGR